MSLSIITMLRLAVAAIACALLGGCAITAPRYQSSIDNVQVLQRLGPVKLAVGTVKLDEAQGEALNRLAARADTVNSPYGGSYAEYLKEALRADLVTAGKYDPNAPHTITAVLLENQLNAGGFNANDAVVAARFTVTADGKVKYDRKHSAKHEWDSSLLGGIAIPRAVQNYGATVQKLLRSLFTDPDFKAAVSD